jgi:fengycin family lipopeptide synthetase E
MTPTPSRPLDYAMPQSDAFRPLDGAWIDQSAAAAFTSTALRFSENVAVSDGKVVWTYAELARRVEGLAASLSATLPIGVPVAIALPMEACFPLAMLACLRAGVPYVPIDLSFPEERNSRILEASGVSAAITSEAFGDRIESLVTGLQVFLVEKAASADSSEDRGAPDQIAYVLFTSGSTGKPKGVFQNHRNLLHDVMQYINSIHLTASDRTTLVYSPSVNGAIRDIYGALLVGAAVEMVDLRRTGFKELERRVQSGQLSIVHAMPPVLRAFLSGRSQSAPVESVRLVYMAGDRLFKSDVEACRRHFPKAILYVGIGSTECATIYRQWFIEPGTAVEEVMVPVGFAVPERRSDIILEDGSCAGAGKVGEIIVSSRHIALGYWRDEASTRESFTRVVEDASARQFRTGDLGWVGPDGLLRFVGRKDRQVKVRGYRVEIGEVEAHLLLAPGVRDAAVVTPGDGDGQGLIGFVAGGDADDIKGFLRARIPPHFIPDRIVVLADLPKLENFKTDYAGLLRLVEPAKSPPSSSRREDEPVDVPAVVAEIWRSMLEPGSYEGDKTFAESGGDSLLALKLVLALETRLGIAIPTETIGFETRPSHVVARVQRPQGRPRSGGPFILLFPGIWSADVWTEQFAARLRHFADVEVIDYRSGGDEFRGEMSTDALFTHIQSLIRVKGSGQPLWILGHSLGAAVAYAMACRFAEIGVSVPILGLIDGDSVTEGRNILSARSSISVWARRQVQHVDEAKFWSRAVSGVCTRVAVILCRYRKYWLLRAWLRILEGDTQWTAWRASTRLLRLAQFGRLVTKPYPGRVILFCSGDPRFQSVRPPDLGWSNWCPNLEIFTVGGSHVRILSDRDNAALLNHLRAMALGMDSRGGRGTGDPHPFED